MTNFILSSTIGKIKQNERFDDLWESAKVKIPFFNNEKHTFSLLDYQPEEDPNFINDADQALENFLNLTNDHRLNISDSVVDYAQQRANSIEDYSNDFLQNIKNSHDVWKGLKPTDLYIVRAEDKDRKIYIQAVFDCEWAPKCGLQLVYEEGNKLTRISVSDGNLNETASDVANTQMH